jgi:predicted enzyme related to lactoylglutathione lyase
MDFIMNPCRIEWITVPAPDLDTAKIFYNRVFGFELSEYNDHFCVFKAGNIDGGFDKDLTVNSKGIGFSITVPNITQIIQALVENGGHVLKTVYSLGPGSGFSAKFSDPNGNVLELYSQQY